MDLIREMVDSIIILVRVGVVFRVGFCFFRMQSNEDQFTMYKTRMIHALVFYAIAESAWLIKAITKHYFG